MRGADAAAAPSTPDGAALSAADSAPLQLTDLPPDVVRFILLALPVRERARCALVCRAWRALTEDAAVWSTLDLRALRLDGPLLRAIATRARGTLRSLALTASGALAPGDVVAIARAAHAAELHVSAPPSPHDSDAEAEDEDAAVAARAGAHVGAWSAQHAAALQSVARVALSVSASAMDAELTALLRARRLTWLALERAELGPAHAAALADAAGGQGSPLRCLRLRLNSIGAAGTIALAGLAPSLSELHLGWNDCGDAGATALAAALCSDGARLQTLDLRHCGVGAAGVVALGRAIATGAPLTRLCLRHCHAGTAGSAALAAALRQPGCTLRHLDLGHNGLGRSAVSALARSGLGSLISLGLAHNSICPAAAVELAAALRRNTRLCDLDVGRNALGDEGCRELCVALRGHANLRRLSAPIVAAGPEAARRFGGLLRGCAALTALDVSGNALGRGVTALAAGLADGSGALRSLRLRATAADDASVHALANAIRPSAGGAGVLSLDLRGCPVGDDGAHALAAAAAIPGSRLRVLDLRDTFIGAADRGAAELHRAAALRHGQLALRGVPDATHN